MDAGVARRIDRPGRARVGEEHQIGVAIERQIIHVLARERL
jgi:hypothetical protein